VKLYTRVATAAVDAILEAGFSDRDVHLANWPGRWPPRGVLVGEQPPPEREGAEPSVIVALTLPEDARIRDFEIHEQSNPWREWVIPASLVNRFERRLDQPW
jgi:hypothetical protein